MTETVSSAEARQLYDSAFVWDAHAGVFPDPRVDLSLLDDWRKNGVDYLSINIGFDVLDWQRSLATLTAYRRHIRSNPDRYILAECLADIDRAAAEKRLAVSFDIEGMNALDGDVNMVDVYHALGVRQMLFAYNLTNDAAGGCHDGDNGLTSFGRSVVERMNELGILVDCSHVSHRASMDLIEASSKPVVFSHSNPNAVWRHQRNIEDDQIRACAATGGVIGINGMGIFLGDNDTRPETVVRHVEYISDLVGPEHIGFGFDYSPDLDLDVGAILRSRPDFWPAGNQYDTPGIGHAGPPLLPRIVDLLLRDGFDENAIGGMLGLNFRRVVESVWM